MDMDKKDEFLLILGVTLPFLKKQQDLRLCCGSCCHPENFRNLDPGFLGPGPFLGAGISDSTIPTLLKWDPRLWLCSVPAMSLCSSQALEFQHP